jgi:exopolysaccharide biosynthesis protein
MKMMQKLFIVVFLIFFKLYSAMADYNYELIEKDGHKIHLITLSPKDYEISLVSAHDQVFGRERVGEIAQRKQADIAINAGFFEIGNNEDGRPSGTLIIDGKIFGLMKPRHACLVKKNGQFVVEIIKPELDIEIDGSHFTPFRFNRFITGKGQGIYFYTGNWGPSTLSSYNDRKEVVLDAGNKVVLVSNFGNSKIPENGYVISFPSDADLSLIKEGAVAKFNWTPDYITNSDTSAVLGIPALILDGKIQEGLDNKSSHARTAIGIKANGDLAILVAEHAYNASLKAMTLEQARKIVKEKEIPIDTLTVIQLHKILTEHIKTDNAAIGLTKQELAEFLKSKGCVSAINLDGGGSSTLYMEGKYINQSIGDVDEAMGQAVVRPVSDAIIFKKR